MKRVALEIAIGSLRIGHEARAVESGNGVGMGQSGGDDLASTRVTSHEMRFNQAGSDPEVRRYETSIEAYYGAAAACVAEQNVVLIPAGVVVFNSHLPQYPWIANQLVQLFPQVGPMQAGCHQNPDGFGRNACLKQSFNQRTKEQMVRHGPGNVADCDRNAARCARQLFKGSRLDRFLEGFPHGS